jgi:ATP-binding cassette, subfamily B, bacterial
VEAAIHDALRHRRAGRTTVVIAQRLSTIALADRVILLDEGRAVAEGTHSELLASEPRYADVLARAAESDARAADATLLDDDALPAGEALGTTSGDPVR